MPARSSWDAGPTLSDTTDPALRGQRLEREHGVGDRDVFEELVARLEVGDESTDRRLVGRRVPSGERRD